MQILIRRQPGSGLCCVIAAAGEPVEQVTINHVEAAAAPDRFANEVRATITVSSAGQKPVGGSASSALEAIEDGRPVTVASVSRSDDPMAVVLVVDTSGSMQARDSSGQTSMQAARQAASGFMAILSPDDRVALFSFNKEPRLCADLYDRGGGKGRCAGTQKDRRSDRRPQHGGDFARAAEGSLPGAGRPA